MPLRSGREQPPSTARRCCRSSSAAPTPVDRGRACEANACGTPATTRARVCGRRARRCHGLQRPHGQDDQRTAPRSGLLRMSAGSSPRPRGRSEAGSGRLRLFATFDNVVRRSNARADPRASPRSTRGQASTARMRGPLRDAPPSLGAASRRHHSPRACRPCARPWRSASPTASTATPPSSTRRFCRLGRQRLRTSPTRHRT